MKRMWMALMLVPALAWAQPAGWKYIGKDENGPVYIIDVTFPKTGNPVVWMAREINTPRGVRSGRVAFEIDCGRAASRVVSSEFFLGPAFTGELVNTTKGSEPWSHVALNTQANTIPSSQIRMFGPISNLQGRTLFTVVSHLQRLAWLTRCVTAQSHGAPCRR